MSTSIVGMTSLRGWLDEGVDACATASIVPPPVSNVPVGRPVSDCPFAATTRRLGDGRPRDGVLEFHSGETWTTPPTPSGAAYG